MLLRLFDYNRFIYLLFILFIFRLFGAITNQSLKIQLAIVVEFKCETFSEWYKYRYTFQKSTKRLSLRHMNLNSRLVN